MNSEQFFSGIDLSFRLMKARQAFFSLLLRAGIISSAVTAGAALLSIAYFREISLVCLVMSIIISAAAAVRSYVETNPYEAALFYDRAVMGGERFPALQELVRENEKNWVRDELEQECRSIIDRNKDKVFPFFRGSGRYFLLPFLAVSVILVLPEDTGGNARIIRANESIIGISESNDDSIAENHGDYPDERTNANRTPAQKWNMTREELEGMKKLFSNEAFRQMLKEYIREGSGYNRTPSNITRDILNGDTASAELFISFIEELSGGAGLGPGAGHADAFRKALSENDLARAAAEFEQFLSYLKTRSARTVILRMKGRIEEFRQRSILTAERGDSMPDSDPLRVTDFPRSRTVSVPVQYREIVTRYFHMQRTGK